jgi:hypothetical protein
MHVLGEACLLGLLGREEPCSPERIRRAAATLRDETVPQEHNATTFSMFSALGCQ